MITDGLLDFIVGCMTFLANSLPEVDLSGFLSNFELVTTNLAALNYYLPIAEVFGFVLAVFYVLPLFLGTTLVLWIVALIRGGNASA